ncbi:MAG: DUF4973 domain-containing protein [Draconibacterium sp.]
MKTKKYHILYLLAILMGFAACNEEWTEEQYEQFISFKAPLDVNGVTPIYVRYRADSVTSYKLPLIVSGSLNNQKDMTINVAVDPDTLNVLNQERFQSRTDLYYEELSAKYFSMPETVNISAGEDVSLMNIDFSLSDIDLVDKWVLPLTVAEDPAGEYRPNPRKNYSKALLRVMPFNDYSGTFSGTALKTYLRGSEGDAAIVKSEVTVYVVDENTVFFYAGTVDEDRIDRRNYKIVAHFNEQNRQVELSSDNPDMQFQVNGTPVFSIEETMDATRPYLLHRYVTISKIDYYFTDYTSVPNATIDYTVRGSLTLQRDINTQIPDEDQAIEW